MIRRELNLVLAERWALSRKLIASLSILKQKGVVDVVVWDVGTMCVFVCAAYVCQSCTAWEKKSNAN